MAPWYRALSEQIDLKVIYLRRPTPDEQGIGFGVPFSWDIPLRQGYSNTVLGCSPGWNAVPEVLSGLRRELRLFRPNVVMISGWNEPGLIASYPLMRLMRLPVIVRGEANLLRQRPWWARCFHRQLLRMISGAISIGQSNRLFYIANGLCPRRVFPGCYFVESERMLKMAERHAADRRPLRASFGFTDQDIVFCFVGKHVAFKRPSLLIAAAKELREKGLPVKLLFGGSGDLTERLKAEAARLNVPSHFTGFLNQTELWQVYITADALVLPSNSSETWGLVVNEAMLFGLPVIVSDEVGCGPDLVRQGETGYVFSGGVDGLTQAMEQLVSQSDHRRSMGEQGRKLVRTEYSMPAATAGLESAIRALTS